MAKIRFLWFNHWDKGTLTYSSQDADFPAYNTQHRWHTRCWHSDPYESGALVDEWLKMDISGTSDYGLTPNQVQALAIKNHNFEMEQSGDGLWLQGNDTDAWGAPAYEAQIEITPETIIHFTGNRIYRYWRLLMTDVLNSDSYLKIGRIYLGPFFEPYYNYAKRSITLVDESTVKRSTGGQISSDQKGRYYIWNYDFEAVRDADLDVFKDIWEEVGNSRAYFVVKDADLVDAYKYTHYIQNRGEWDFDPVVKGYDTFGVELEEML